jgi:hypothetical protein
MEIISKVTLNDQKTFFKKSKNSGILILIEFFSFIFFYASYFIFGEKMARK